MHRPECSPDNYESISRDMAELASALKSRRVLRGLQNALKRGQSPVLMSPVLSLSAAVSASLVSAAANELVEDPLAGLVTVDDLSALAGEICLPGEAYADDHDHGQGSHALTHAGSHGGPFYLADPFASPYANSYSSAHSNHNQSAHGGSHESASNTSIHAQHGATLPGAVSSSPNHQHGEHANALSAGSGHHAASSGDQHAGADYQMAGISHGSIHADQSGDHAAHGAAAAHAGHQMASGAEHSQATHHATIAVDHTAHEMNDHADGVGVGADGLSDLIDSLTLVVNDSPADEHFGMDETVSGDDAEPNSSVLPPDAVPSDEHHHHGVSLADLDVAPVDDLSASQPTPII